MQNEIDFIITNTIFIMVSDVIRYVALQTVS